MRHSYSAWFSLLLAVILLSVSTAAAARNKKSKTPAKEPQDSIEIVGHISLANGPITRFISTRHYSSYYLYAEHGDGKLLTLIDVSKAAHPNVLADVAYPSNGGANTVFAVAGTAALVAEGPAADPPLAAAETIRIMDLSDPQHPRVARELAGVTAISRDERRDLIFVANADGIWILHQTFAEDPAVEKAYSDYVLYSH